MKKVLLTVVLLVAALMVSSGAGMAALYNGSDYQVVASSGTNWTAAGTAAEALGSGWHLVTITSQGEQDFVAGLLAGYSDGLFWGGGYQTPNMAQASIGWNWVTGEAWNYTSWATPTIQQSALEPNDWGGANEIYLALDGRFLRNWNWNDGLTTDGIIGYVAERSVSVPEPSTMLLLGSGLLGLLGCGRRRFKK